MAKPATPEALFPALPEDLTALSDEELDTLKAEFGVAADMIESGDEEYTKGLDETETLAQYEAGVESMEAIAAEEKARVEAGEAYQARMTELADRRRAANLSAEDEKSEETEEEEGEGEDAEASVELSAEETEVEETEEEEKVEEPEVVVAAAETKPTRLRKPPTPAADRVPNGSPRPVMVAAAGVEGVRVGAPISDRMQLATAMKATADRWGRVAKHEGGVEQRILISNVSQPFDESRILHRSDWQANQEKIEAVIPAAMPGLSGIPLTAAGVLCAPLEPLYGMPNFATLQRPVRDALPSFQAERGGVNVPTATYIGDITSAISVIDQADEELGGTFATKSCQDLECPAYTEVPVTTISHCREYGNLNSMAWPEKIAHENDLTMAAHARVAEGYLLDRIKALSVNVTAGADTLGALIYLVDALVKGAAGIRYRLRMSPEARFRALIPAAVLDLLVIDTVSTQFDRFQTKANLVSYLRSVGIEPTFYIDAVTSGAPFDASQDAGALDGFTESHQIALYPEGAFIHVDSGTLELGIVRDSTLNSTNDYQIFGESFENVARLAPAQAAFWVTLDICPVGQFPPAGTARTCES